MRRSLAASGSAIWPGRQGQAALAIAGLGAAAVGCYDDLAGTGDRRGFRGHLGALAKGEVTTGAVKLAWSRRVRTGRRLPARLPRRLGGGRGVTRADTSAAGRVADVGINAGLVAGAANLVNLFDLRPGRAIKVSLLASAALAATGPQARASVAAPAGAALALLPEDLGERAMLGDSGANALGAMLGVAAASSLPRRARLGVLAGIVGLTVASEKVSFTKVIARTRRCTGWTCSAAGRSRHRCGLVRRPTDLRAACRSASPFPRPCGDHTRIVRVDRSRRPCPWPTSPSASRRSRPGR